MFRDDKEAFEYLLMIGCIFTGNVIYPPQAGYESFNSGKNNWMAINTLIQNYGYVFERYRPW